MLQQKSLKDLIDILQDLESQLEKPNPKKKQPLFNENDNLILNSTAQEIEKKKWVISKMVLVRTAIFSEYSDRIEQANKERDLAKAVDLMNEYIFRFAVPFIDRLKPPSRSDRLSTFFKKRTVLTPYEYLQKWKTDYEAWGNLRQSSDKQIDDYVRSQKYLELSGTYICFMTFPFQKTTFQQVRLS